MRRLPVRTSCAKTFILVLSLFCWGASGANAQETVVKDGNVFFRASADAIPTRLTSSGLDSEATLSPDGRSIAFVRRTPGDTVDVGTGDEEASELWLVAIDGKNARRLLRGRGAEKMEDALARLRLPTFSPDGKQIYFLSAAWMTSNALHAFDLERGTQRYICPANSLEVVPRGEYAGHFIVMQHRYFMIGGSYDWIWLLRPDGSDVGPIWDGDAENVEERLKEFRSMHIPSATAVGAKAAPPDS